MRSFPELIAAKRDGAALSDQEIGEFLTGAVDGSIPAYQVAAMLMAIYFKGMSDEELAAFTTAMVDSGDRLEITVDRPLVDKHSTGGVGDKVSLALAPLAAACGVAVPMMSGRGLGHTGGTLDKLESIPGFRTDLTPDEFGSVVAEVGCVIAGQSDRIVPADRTLYALRDTTATVASIPLIASSIMSKKLAEGLDALVLDIKVGTGAFMTSLDDARVLAHAMWSIGKSAGVDVVCLLTRMDDPLGVEVGNANELREAIDVLAGRGPTDVTELVLAQGAAMLESAGVSDGPARLTTAVASGEGLAVLERMVAAQGGEPTYIADPSRLPVARHVADVEAPTDGVVASIDSKAIGLAGVDLGAGRSQAGAPVDHGAGTTLLAQRGQVVQAGQPIARVRTSDQDRLASARLRVQNAFSIADAAQPQPPLIIEHYPGPQ